MSPVSSGKSQISICALLKEAFTVRLTECRTMAPFRQKGRGRERERDEREKSWMHLLEKTRTITTRTIFNVCHLVRKSTAKSQCCRAPTSTPRVFNRATWSSKSFLLSGASLSQRSGCADKPAKECGDRREGRQTGSLFSPLFLDKYLISGTLMGIDWSPYPLLIDPSSLWSLVRWSIAHTHIYTHRHSCNLWMSNKNERLKA